VTALILSAFYVDRGMLIASCSHDGRSRDPERSGRSAPRERPRALKNAMAGVASPALSINPPTSLGPGVTAPLQNMVLRSKVRTVQQVLGGFMIKAASPLIGAWERGRFVPDDQAPLPAKQNGCNDECCP
jgi:hypothetical protein